MISALRTVGVVILVGSVLLVVSSRSAAQQEAYVQYAYMDVAPGQEDAYLELEQDVWKPVHQLRLEDGAITGWHLYEVVLPGGTGPDYDYVTVSYYEDWNQVEVDIADAYFEEVHPDRDPQQIFEETVETRSLVRSDVVEILDRVDPGGYAEQPGDYLVVDFLRVPVGGQAPYVHLERVVWEPIHRELIEAGSQLSWFVGGRQFVEDDDPYQYLTARVFDSWAGVEPAAQMNALSSAVDGAHPDTTLEEIITRTEGARILVRREIWRLVDRLEPNE